MTERRDRPTTHVSGLAKISPATTPASSASGSRAGTAEAVDDEFREQVAAVIGRIVADEPPRKVPSERECAWCVVSSDD